VDDLVGEIMSDAAARKAIFNVLGRVGAPGFLKAVLSNEGNLPLRQVLHMLPNYDDAVKMMNDALTNL
jgi:hypothetical protein